MTRDETTIILNTIAYYALATMVFVWFAWIIYSFFSLSSGYWIARIENWARSTRESMMDKDQ